MAAVIDALMQYVTDVKKLTCILCALLHCHAISHAFE